jgi:hypothetical protein
MRLWQFQQRHSLTGAGDWHSTRRARLQIYVKRAANCRRAPQRSRKLRAFGLGAARHFAEHFAGASGAKLAHLGLNALAAGRYPR